jgi:predicted kinase
MNNSVSSAKIFLFVGPIGAGKSTYSRRFAHERGGIVFSIDEWMVNLFQADSPLIATVNWLLARIDRCENQMWKMIPELLAKNIDIILDLGGLSRPRRAQVIARCLKETGQKPEVFFICASRAVREQRVLQRNLGDSPTYTVKISKFRFRWAEKRFDVPDVQEISNLQIIHND